MLDVIHYLFEEDARFSTAEQADATSSLRTQLYRQYNKTYRYATSSSSGKSGRAYVPKGSAGDFDFDDPMFSSNETKSYIPPTEFNPDSVLPFGADIGAPLR